MHPHFHLDVDRIRAEGLCLIVGSRLTRGRLLRLKGHSRIAAGFSDLPTLAEYTEVEVVGMNGAPSLFIATESIISYPQLFIGFHESGCPIFIGAAESSKSTTLASMVFQLSRLGYCVASVCLKDTDSVLVGSMKAGADSL